MKLEYYITLNPILSNVDPNVDNEECKYNEDPIGELQPLSYDISDIELDTDITSTGYIGITSDNQVLVSTFNIEDVVNVVLMQQEAHRLGISTRVLGYWKCEDDTAKVVTEHSRYRYYTDITNEEANGIFLYYKNILRQFIKLMYNVGIVGEYLMIYEEEGNVDVIGFSEKSRVDITVDPFEDIKKMTSGLIRLNLNNPEYKSFIKTVMMNLFDIRGYEKLENILHSMNRILTEDELFDAISNKLERVIYWDNIEETDNYIYDSTIKDLDICIEDKTDYIGRISITDLDNILFHKEQIHPGTYRGLYEDIYVILKVSNISNSHIQDRASKFGISANVLSYWKCGNSEVFIIVDIEGIKLREYIKGSEYAVEAILRSIETILYMNIEAKIVHNNINLNNIIVVSNDVFIINYDDAIESSYIELNGLLVDLIQNLDKSTNMAYNIYYATTFNGLDSSIIEGNNWHKEYNRIESYYQHLLRKKYSPIYQCVSNEPKASKLNGLLYEEVKLRDITYTKMEITVYGRYYYGVYQNRKVTVVVSDDYRQFSSHQRVSELGIAPKVLGYYQCNREYILVHYGNNNFNELKYYEKDISYIITIYTAMLWVITKLNMESSMYLERCSLYMFEFFLDKKYNTVKALITKFPTAISMKDFRVGHAKHLKDQIDSIREDLLKILTIYRHNGIEELSRRLPSSNNVYNAMTNSNNNIEAMNKIKSLLKK